MDVFTIGGKTKPVKVWGPTASVNIEVPALGSVVGNSWVLEGMQVGAKEIVDIRQCFNDVSYIYALGNDQSRCSITLSFVVFIGTEDCKGNNNMSAIKAGLEAYKNSRISKTPTVTHLGIGGFATKGWLIGIDIGQLDAERGLCHGVATFIMQLGA